MAGIQEDGKFEPHADFAQQLQAAAFPQTPVLPPMRNHNRHFQFTGSFEDTFQDDEIGDVEVSNRDTVSSCFLKLSIHTAVLAASKSRPSVLDVRHAFLLWSCRRCCVR